MFDIIKQVQSVCISFFLSSWVVFLFLLFWCIYAYAYTHDVYTWFIYSHTREIWTHWEPRPFLWDRKSEKRVVSRKETCVQCIHVLRIRAFMNHIPGITSSAEGKFVKFGLDLEFRNVQNWKFGVRIIGREQKCQLLLHLRPHIQIGTYLWVCMWVCMYMCKCMCHRMSSSLPVVNTGNCILQSWYAKHRLYIKPPYIYRNTIIYL